MIGDILDLGQCGGSNTRRKGYEAERMRDGSNLKWRGYGVERTHDRGNALQGRSNIKWREPPVKEIPFGMEGVRGGGGGMRCEGMRRRESVHGGEDTV